MLNFGASSPRSCAVHTAVVAPGRVYQAKWSPLKNSFSSQRKTHCAGRGRFVDKKLSQLTPNVPQTAGLQQAQKKEDALFHDHAQQPADVEACSAQNCMQTVTD